MKTLKKVLGVKASASGADEVPAEFNDPTKRDTYMKKLVEEGRAKISTASKITKGVGDVAKFILSAKGMIDMAIQNVPQAALPWAGVCVGLQVSSHTSQLGFASTNIHPGPLESCECDKVQPCRHHSCRLQNGLVLRPDRTSPE